ncbi:MAG TPA: HNH endonuclease, partial [Armatimonadota bacterium]|nr:HNH endonuclease [Armatimonadota bacterium]
MPSKKTGTEAQLWGTVQGLEKAHIMADSLGGLATPDNFFLLCRKCHGKAPNTGNKDLFFAWATRQDWSRDLAREINNAMELLSQYPGERATFMMWLDDLGPDKVKKAIKEAAERSALHLGHPDSESISITDLIGSLYREFAESPRSAFEMLFRRYPPRTVWKDSEDQQQPPWTYTAQHKYTTDLGEDWYAYIDAQRRVVLL